MSKRRIRQFCFSGTEINQKKNEFSFFYSILRGGETQKFTEKIKLPFIGNQSANIDFINRLMPSLHLALGLSYYKLYPLMEISSPHSLTEEQARFFNTLYRKGLGEYFYRHSLNPRDFPGFTGRNRTENEPPRLNLLKRAIIGIGGGKDSLTAANALVVEDHQTAGFLVETGKKHVHSRLIADKLKLKDNFLIQRIIDPKLLKSDNDYLPGHIPVSAVYAFLGVLTAGLNGYKYVVCANEKSSNFGSLRYQNMEINHQWSKSEEFELLFDSYIRKFICPDIKYFSLLRPFYDIRIAREFAGLPDFFNFFRSCNQNFQIKSGEAGPAWCGHCAKCAFTYLVLAPFIPKERLMKIFGVNLLAQKKLGPVYASLFGLEKFKPFECVGTTEESAAALHLLGREYKNDYAAIVFKPRVKAGGKMLREVFKSYPAVNIPHRFRFLLMRNCLLVGKGRENRAMSRYLGLKYPLLKRAFADQKQDDSYLSRQAEYDIVVRSPGVNKNHLERPCTTATNQFFDRAPGIIVGVTGSKGKSTTASLIYSILKTAGKNAELVGNIGRPAMLSLIDRKKKEEKTIYVYELSSFQLSDLDLSPHIAVLTALFPEHLDYHQSLDEYYAAKKRIISHQQSEDYFVYDPADRIAAGWARHSIGKAIPYDYELFKEKFKTRLPGEHNRRNIAAAITAALLLGIKLLIIAKAVKNFKPLAHRLEKIGTFNKITFYNDSLSTAPESTIAAIRSLPGIGALMLGGKDRGSDFRRLRREIVSARIGNLILFPDTGQKIAAGLKNINLFYSDNMESAVNLAFRHTPRNSICLLSCASPSYSLWRDYKQKGNQFRCFVKQYGREKKNSS